MTRDTEPDMRVVDALCRGVTPARPSTYSERVLAVRHLARHGFTDGQTATLIRVSRRTVLRIRSEHRIAGVPVGVNRHTRLRDHPSQVI